MGAAVSQALAALGLGAQPPAAWLAAAALGLVALGTLVWLRARPRRRGRLQQVGTVQQLYIYPVKSCKAVAVSEAECTALGLRRGHLRDRYAAGPGRGRRGACWAGAQYWRWGLSPGRSAEVCDLGFLG